MCAHFVVCEGSCLDCERSVLMNLDRFSDNFSGKAPKWRSGLSRELTGSGQRLVFLLKLSKQDNKQRKGGASEEGVELQKLTSYGPLEQTCSTV